MPHRIEGYIAQPDPSELDETPRRPSDKTNDFASCAPLARMCGRRLLIVNGSPVATLCSRTGAFEYETVSDFSLSKMPPRVVWDDTAVPPVAAGHPSPNCLFDLSSSSSSSFSSPLSSPSSTKRDVNVRFGVATDYLRTNIMPRSGVRVTLAGKVNHQFPILSLLINRTAVQRRK